MLSRLAMRALQRPTLRTSLASSLEVASSTAIWTRSMARHNRPNPNNKPNHPNHNHNHPNNRQGEGSRAPGAPPKSTAPGVAFTPSHPGAAAAYKAGRIDLSKGQDKGIPQGKEDGSTSPEEQLGFKGTHPPERGLPETEATTKPLPDLRYGIPSTLEYETTSSSLNLTESEDPHSGGGRGKGELPASAYISSSDRKRDRFANIMYSMFAGSLVLGVFYLGRNWDLEEEERRHPNAPSGWAIGLMWSRAKARLGDQLNYYTEPAFEKLLPKQDPAFERPYTLVISLEDMLLHSEWSRDHGWRMAKRPGVDYFLRYLSNYYEIVIFTSQPFQMAEPVVRKLDPFRIAQWSLFREATKYDNGDYVKDLSYLNRDLSKVILIDTNLAHAKKQPENAIILEKWKGDTGDKDLVSLIPFLEYLCIMGTPDVRKAIASFEGKHIPTEFARRDAISRAKYQSQHAEERTKTPKVSGLGMLSGMLGIKGGMMSMDGQQRAGEGLAQGKMLQDLAREDAIKNYQALEKEIRENGEKWLQEEAANEKLAQQEGMKAMKSGFAGWFGGP